MAPRRRSRRPWYRTRAYRLTRTAVLAVTLVAGGVWWAQDEEPAETVTAAPAGSVGRADATGAVASGVGEVAGSAGMVGAGEMAPAAGVPGAAGGAVADARGPKQEAPPGSSPRSLPSQASARQTVPSRSVPPRHPSPQPPSAGHPGPEARAAGRQQAAPAPKTAGGSHRPRPGSKAAATRPQGRAHRPAQPRSPAATAGRSPATPSRPQAAPPRSRATSKSARPRPLPRSRATRLAIPYLGIDAPIMDLRLDAERRLPAPPEDDPKLVGWYAEGPTPGEQGTAVAVGHLDTDTGPAVFAPLSELERGRQVEVRRADGRIAVYTVDAIKTYDKAHFPDREVYGPRGRPELRLITCGGTFDREKGYTGNLVVFAHLTKLRAPHTH
ncbi:class F sortase [Streptomyces sp. NPDC051315]|uniref:class F sortase n=1 Tax=Streptomyces sp. NPDC051315 TaxID=3365650 RepID=UPI00378EA305